MSHKPNALGYFDSTDQAKDTIKANAYTAQARDQLTDPDPGMIVFDPDTESLLYWNGTTWMSVNQAVTRNILNVSSSGTIPDDIDAVVCDASAGAFTLILPLQSHYPGKQLSFIKSDASSNDVTLEHQGVTDKVGDSHTTRIMLHGQDSVVILMSAGTGVWYTV